MNCTKGGLVNRWSGGDDTHFTFDLDVVILQFQVSPHLLDQIPAFSLEVFLFRSIESIYPARRVQLQPFAGVQVSHGSAPRICLPASGQLAVGGAYIYRVVSEKKEAGSNRKWF